MEHFGIIHELRKKGESLSELYLDKLYEVIRKQVPRFIKFCTPSIYSSWDAFMTD